MSSTDESQHIYNVAFQRKLEGIVAIGIACVLLGGLWWLFTERARWNRIYVASRTHLGRFQAFGSDYTFQIDCSCPDSVVEGSTVNLTLTLRVFHIMPPAGNNSPPVDIRVDAGSTATKLQPVDIPKLAEMNQGEEVFIPLKMQLIDVRSDLSEIHIRLVSPLSARHDSVTILDYPWPITSRPSLHQVIIPYLYASAVFVAICVPLFWWWHSLREIQERKEKQIDTASSLARANPATARYAWDLAQIKLEAYFDRNLIQVNLVFWVALIVMGIGFLFVLVGVWLAYRRPEVIAPPLVAAVSGIITQFIGVTFMVIYKSTMSQANEFMTVLERINSVGMAVQILDSLKEGTELKDKTRADLATLLTSPRPIVQSPTLGMVR
jgi:hypothetical protein